MTDYRVFPSAPGGAVASDGTAYTMGLEFYVTQPMELTGYWWWCATGASTTPVEHGLFTVATATTGTLVSGSAVTSGTLTAGQWNFTALSPAVDLAANTRYRAGAAGGGSGNWYGAVTDAFPADITNGPLVAPSTANAVGGVQNGYVVSSVLAYPEFSIGNGYGVDVQVSDPASSATATAATAGVSVAAPGSPAGIAAQPGAATATATAANVTTHLPQTAARSYAYGYEPARAWSGQEPVTDVSADHA